MQHLDVKSSTIESIQKAMGEALAGFISQHSDKSAFAKETGINRVTLYRLLNGENVGTDTLLRVLRALGRYDILDLLATPPEKTPIEKLEKNRKNTPIPKSKNSAAPIFSPLKLSVKKEADQDG